MLAPILPEVLSAQDRVVFAGGRLEAEIEGVPTGLGRERLLGWIDTASRAVTSYYGTFPVSHARLVIVFTSGRGVSHGTARGEPEPVVRLELGRDSEPQDLDDDWILVHEFVHLGFPSLARRHHWMEEGLATYVEPIARLRIGALTAPRVWGDLVEGLPKGEPKDGDEGMDLTPTWGRTYWGGAMFWLLADIEIRERSENRIGLEVALRAIVKKGGTIASSWTVDEVIAAGDGATGFPVLRELYDRMSSSPSPVDLDALWQRLGVNSVGGHVSFDEAAPLAAIRRAIGDGHR
jgi:hypothetical protein